MWRFNIATLLIIVIMVCPHQILSYNTNRQVVLVKDNCDYYDNPVFQVQPNFLQNRIKEDEQSPQVILIENRIRKDTPPYYHMYNKAPMSVSPTKYEPKIPENFFPNMTPVNLAELEASDLTSYSQENEKNPEEEEEEEINIDYDKLWKVGEIPPVKSVQALPDVYVKPGDAPPIVDMLSMEKSELTEETHDLEDVELEEKYLTDPQSQTREVIIERVNARPEPLSGVNPALEMFKEIDLSRMMSDTLEKSEDELEDDKDKQKEDSSVEKQKEGSSLEKQMEGSSVEKQKEDSSANTTATASHPEIKI